MEFFVSAFDSPEPDPNGKFRIFGIGTKVRVLTGQTGTVVQIHRKKLTVHVPAFGGWRNYYPHQLEIIQ